MTEPCARVRRVGFRRAGALTVLLILGVLEVSARPGVGPLPVVPAWAEGASGPGAGVPAPPKPPANAQECFDKYLANQDRCYDVCCLNLFWFFHVDCDHSCLIPCFSKAEQTYLACLGKCPHCGGPLD